MKRLGVLLSGRGSNFEALFRATEEGRLAATIATVISNVESAPGLARASQAGLSARFEDHRGRSREEHDACMLRILRAEGVDYVCLAGYRRRLSSDFLQAYPSRVVNVHPSLLPSFPGLNAQKQALEYGARVTGVSIHLVDEGLDTGPILAQRALPVLESDTIETLSSRLLEVEHQLYPETLSRLLSESWRVAGRRVVFEGFLAT